MKYKPKPLSFFMSRIGKTVYRDKHTCCDKCDQVARDGLFIASKEHAEYLAMIDLDFANCGTYLNYRDKKYIKIPKDFYDDSNFKVKVKPYEEM